MPKRKKEQWHAFPHTRAKHQILRIYIRTWLAILGNSAYDRLLIVDGFCGYGEHKQNDGTFIPGSPRIILEEVAKVIRRGGAIASKTVDVLLIDNDPKAIAHLRDVVLPKLLKDVPKNVNVAPVEGNFDGELRKALAAIAPGGETVPSFVLADPFSFRSVDMDLLHEILQHEGSEVLVTFMTDQVNRSLEHPSDDVRKYLERLLGAKPNDWQHVLDAKRRVDALIDFYETRLRSAAKYVRSFRMIRKDGHVSYDLVFATNHIRGLDEMKKAMWKVDRIGGDAFFDRAAGMGTLFDDNPDVGPLRRAFLERFAGQTVLSDDVVDYAITDTVYHSGHVKKLTLGPMEGDGDIEYVETRGEDAPKHRLGSYPPGTMIRFRGV